MKLTTITEDRHTFTYEHDGETMDVTINRAIVTGDRTAQFEKLVDGTDTEAAIDAIKTLLSETILEWGLTDPEDDSKWPITYEGMGNLPMFFINDMLAEIMGGQEITEGKDSSPGTSPPAEQPGTNPLGTANS